LFVASAEHETDIELLLSPASHSKA
jgi:hypothetical protein